MIRHALESHTVHATELRLPCSSCLLEASCGKQVDRLIGDCAVREAGRAIRQYFRIDIFGNASIRAFLVWHGNALHDPFFFTNVEPCFVAKSTLFGTLVLTTPVPALVNVAKEMASVSKLGRFALRIASKCLSTCSNAQSGDFSARQETWGSQAADCGFPEA